MELKTTKLLENKLQAITDAMGADDLLHDIGRAIRTRVEMGFRNTTDPYGDKWQSLKYRSGQPLSDTGRLRNSISYEVQGDALVVGTNVCYAIVHQFGATVEATGKKGVGLCGESRKGASLLAFPTPGGWIRAKKVTIPARPIFPDSRGMPPAWAKAIKQQIEQRFKQL